jgi:two-component system NtrC family response regulator/two-component system response regulator HydG
MRSAEHRRHHSDRPAALDVARVLLWNDAADGGPFDEAAAHLRAQGFLMESTRDADLALAAVQAPDVALVLLAMRPGALALMEALHRASPRLPVIVLAAQPTVAECVRVMQAGAESYLPATAGPELGRAVRRALDRSSPQPRPDGNVVGEGEAIRAVLRQVALVAPTRTTVLLLGETGTGKERLAQAIHEASPRRRGPFVAVNCAALAESLLESELFGHEKGAFSGAHCRRDGRFSAADGGTIFLDEIGEISPAMQVKLLRVLQERRFERVGGNETVSVDVRIVAATNRDLRQMVESRAFRADLFYRLNVMAIAVPPLRARREDIPLLVEHFLPRLALELGLPEPAVAPEAMAALCAHDWPGNVRELENVLERAVVLAQGGVIAAFDLPAHEAEPAPAASGPVVPGASFREIERHAIMATYEACGRSPQRTAEVLGISPRTVHYRLREYRGESGRRAGRASPERRSATVHKLKLVHSTPEPARETGTKR